MEIPLRATKHIGQKINLMNHCGPNLISINRYNIIQARSVAFPIEGKV